MEDKGIITPENYVRSAKFTAENLIQGKCKKEFYIETNRRIYISDSLDSVMNLWSEKRFMFIPDEVINVGSVG